MTLSIDEILAVAADPAHQREATAKILFRQDLVLRHAELDAELAAMREQFADQVLAPEAVHTKAAEVKALEDEMEAARVEFRFRALPYREWLDLLAKHPPTKEQVKARLGVDHNPETFPAAAIAASCVEPAMSEDQAHELERVLPLDQFSLLWGTCAIVNRGGDGLPKSQLAGMILRRNGASATTAASEASPVVSSSDES
jgi:hypothetical protein